MLEVMGALLPPVYAIATLSLLIWALVDLSKRQLANKALWVVVILGIPVIGALGYLIGGRKTDK